MSNSSAVVFDAWTELVAQSAENPDASRDVLEVRAQVVDGMNQRIQLGN